MLDPNRYSLDAATVGFRKRMRQSVDWSAFNEALQTQSESIKVRRELQETPITEIHVMGGQGFGVAGNQKTNEMERQARQMNGYVLRSFLATGGAVVLPTKHTEGLMATPQNLGLPQYTQYNGVMGSYVSSFTEPLNAPMDSGMMTLARLGVQARSEASTNPFKYLQFQLNMHKSQEEIRALEEKHKELRGYNQEGSIQKEYLADQEARRTGKKESRAERRHRLSTTPSTVHSALHGGQGAVSAPLRQAILETLSENVLTPATMASATMPSTPMSSSAAGDLSSYGLESLLGGGETEEPEINIAENTPPRETGRRESLASFPKMERLEDLDFEYVQDDVDALEGMFQGMDPREVKRTYIEEQGNYLMAFDKLRGMQQANMYNVASNVNLKEAPNAIVQEVGLEESDNPASYKNYVDPAFERTVFRKAENLPTLGLYASGPSAGAASYRRETMDPAPWSSPISSGLSQQNTPNLYDGSTLGELTSRSEGDEPSMMSRVRSFISPRKVKVVPSSGGVYQGPEKSLRLASEKERERNRNYPSGPPKTPGKTPTKGSITSPMGNKVPQIF